MAIFDLVAATGREVPFEDIDEDLRASMLARVAGLEGVLPPLDWPGFDSKGAFEVRFDGDPLTPVKTIRGSALSAIAAVLKTQGT